MYLNGVFTGDTGYFNNLVLNGTTIPTSGPLATISDVSSAVWNLIGGAPAELDTLIELANYVSKLDLSNISLLQNLSTKAPLANPTFTGTVGGITSTMVGLGNVDNTTDANKPVSTATQTALDLKAPLANPTFTGSLSAPTFTGATGVFSTSISAPTFTGATGTFDTLVVKRIILKPQ